MPNYQRASYGNEQVTLENAHLRITFFRRESGWGFAEVFTPDGFLLGVLDHLGELMLRDFEIPMRLEAETYQLTESGGETRLAFHVKTAQVQQMLEGTSFAAWMEYPFKDVCLEGDVIFILPADEGVLRMNWQIVSHQNLYASYLKGPWFYAGEASYGADKVDAIFPGVDWVVGREWSSGSDWFKDPWAKKWIPHRNKVTAPVMTLSYQGHCIGLSWIQEGNGTRWFNNEISLPQPVFAAPNFVDRMDNSLLGLMLPDAKSEDTENQMYSNVPLALHKDQRIRFSAELFYVPGKAIDGMLSWVARKGLMDPEFSDADAAASLHRIASAYDTNLWHPGEGFGTKQWPGDIQPKPPAFMERYIAMYPEHPTAISLQKKMAWCSKQPQHKKEKPSLDMLLSWQKEDGAFTFEPDGRHYRKDDFVVARKFHAPMGNSGDTAIDLCATAVIDLLDGFEVDRDPVRLKAAEKTLDFCLPMWRPEGGDYWETPLHAPNLYAAGHAALAYMMGYEHLKKPVYKEKAIHWMRTLIAFTHLWEPASHKMAYNTKPCLCSSDWYFANWVRDHVQWEVLDIFITLHAHGYHWPEIDPGFDWRRFQRGVTAAAVRWMVDHREDTWRPHNIPNTLELYEQGDLDGCFPDTHNTVTGLYGGMCIQPAAIAQNLLIILDWR